LNPALRVEIQPVQRGSIATALLVRFVFFASVSIRANGDGSMKWGPCLRILNSLKVQMAGQHSEKINVTVMVLLNITASIVQSGVRFIE
jgi:hypothetical protein